MESWGSTASEVKFAGKIGRFTATLPAFRDNMSRVEKPHLALTSRQHE
jgi:hypothetical protein